MVDDKFISGLRENAAAARNGSSYRVLVLCPQGGPPEAEFNASIGAALAKAARAGVDVSMACLRQVDAEAIRSLAPAVQVLQSFEAFRRESPAVNVPAEALRLACDYPGANWWQIIAGERSIVDSSFLVGGLGQRSVSRAYVEALVVNMVRYFETIISQSRYSAVMCQVVDSLIIHVFYQVARKFGVQILALTPNAWIREDGKPGFYIGQDEFMHNRRMEEAYDELAKRPMTEDERDRARRYQRTVFEFNILTTYQSITKRPFVVPPFSPNLKRLYAYLKENAARDEGVEYYKIDAFSKAKANVLRVWRRWRSGGLLGPKVREILPRSVFFPMQYQPEQTTLIGGIYFANQISVIENVAKALPFGCTLVVKEHPRGRGSRPAWQYKHLAHFPNVMFCDGDAKDLIKRCDAVVTITSTVGLEAMALDRPVVLLGSCYYDFADIVYKPKSWSEVAQVLRRILIDREYEQNASRQDLIDRFFLSYLVARVPALLSKDSAAEIAGAIIADLDVAGRALRPEDKKTNDRVENG